MRATFSHNRLRVISNYLRLMITFVSGILIVRLLAEVGASSLNIYLIVVSGTGFAFFLKTVMQESVVPLLGLSFEGQEGRSFERTYWISFLFAIVASVFAIVIFGGLWLLRDHFDTGSLTVQTFGIALAAGAMRTVASALATPPLHAVLITGRIFIYNVFLVTERLVDVFAVSLMLWLLRDGSEAAIANGFFLLSAGLYTLVQFCAAIYAVGVDQRFAVHPVRLEAQDLRWARGVFGWNIAVVFAFLLYLRFSTMAVNMAFGEGATLVLGLVFLLIGYQRQISMGLVIGLDAMVARVLGGGLDDDEKKRAVASMLLQSTYVQSVFSFVSVTVLWVLAEPVFRYWLGDSLKGSGWDPETAATLFRIMSLGVLARSLSENWMKILNGQGLVGSYAPWFLTGGVIFSALLLTWMVIGIPLEQGFIWIAITFSILYTLNHLVVVPWLLSGGNRSRFTCLIGIAVGPGGALSLVLIVLERLMHPEESLMRAASWLVVSGLLALIFLLPSIMHKFIK